MKFNNRNVFISPKAKIGKNVKIGDNTTIYDHVEIGDNSIICNDCVIGEPLNSYYSDENYENPVTKIGENALIRSHAIIYANNVIGNNFVTGHNINIRGNNMIGNNCSIGNYTELFGDSKLGNYVRLHSKVIICEHSVLGNFVWVFLGAIFTNDVNPPSNNLVGPMVEDYSIISSNVLLMPGIKIGTNSLIGASSVVTKNVIPFSLMIGSPAKLVMDCRDLVSKSSNQKKYPWMYNFERGMPWEGIGFDEWNAKNSQ